MLWLSSEIMCQIIYFFTDDFAHRTSVRQKLALNPDWQSQYIKTMLPYLDKQENVVLMESPLKKTEDAPLQEGGNKNHNQILV